MSWPVAHDPTIDLVPGTLVRYTWAGSNRLGLVLIRCARERWFSGMNTGGAPLPVDSVLVQWCGGDGPLPALQSHDSQPVGTAEARRRGGIEGWVMVRTARGYQMLERA